MTFSKVWIRQQSILTFTREYREISIDQLSQAFNVSPITVRRDLFALQNRKEIWRIGKNSYTCNSVNELIGHETIFEEIYSRLAKAAVETLNNKDIVFLGPHSTVINVCKVLLTNKQGLTIITSNVKHAAILRDQNLHEVYLLSGKINPETGEIGGVFAQDMLRDYRIDAVILGCRAINPDMGLIIESTSESQTIRTAIDLCRKLIVLADHTKFNTTSSGAVVSLNKVNLILTDEKADRDILNKIREKGVEVLVINESLVKE